MLRCRQVDVRVALGAATGLPVVHLDRLYWGPGWVITDAAEWEARLERALARERWILDGNYGRTMERRLARADTCVFLDMPRTVCLAGVLKRRLRHDRPDPLSAAGSGSTGRSYGTSGATAPSIGRRCWRA